MNTTLNGWAIDLKRFSVFLREKYNVSVAYYFIGAKNDTKKSLYRRIEEAGFILIFREHAQGLKSAKKGNVDTDIVFHLMRSIAEKERYNKAVLVSGDGDYWKTVEYFISKNRFLKLLAPCRKNMSSLYRTKMPDSYCAFLDEEATKRKIKNAGSP